MQHITNKIL